jgi:hypothetical protein
MTPSSGSIVHRSLCRPIPEDDLNFRAVLAVGEGSCTSRRPTIKSQRSSEDGEENTQSDAMDGEDNIPRHRLIIAGPDHLVGRSFLMDPDEDGQRFRVHVVKYLDDLDNALATDKETTVEVAT